MASPERDIQRAIVKQLRQHARPEVIFWHTPNGGRRDIIDAANFKRMGVLAGVSDLLFYFDHNFFALEIKAPGGSATKSQLDFLQKVRDNGGHAVVAEGLKEAIGCIEAWGLFR